MNCFEGAIAYKLSHNLSSCNPPRARKALLMTLLDGQDTRQSSLM